MSDIYDLMQKIMLNKIGGWGHLCVQCACGRTNYAEGPRSSGDYEEGELDELRAKTKAEPGRFVCHHGDDYVSSRRVFGTDYVIGCDCRWEGRIGKALIENRQMIVELLTAYNEERKKSLPAIEAELAVLNEVVKGT